LETCDVEKYRKLLEEKMLSLQLRLHCST
jgi:hypothetical protein